MARQKAKWKQWKGFRFSRGGKRTWKGGSCSGCKSKLQRQDRSKFMMQFPFNLWTTNIHISAQFLTFSFFLPNSSAQLGSIGHHHPCIQLLKKSAAHTHPKKKKKKGKKIDREASQTTSKSKCSQFKIEMGNTTCLEVAFAQLPSSSNAFRTFTDNSPELIDTVEISIYIYIHELMTETSSHPLSHGLFCAAWH